MSHVFRRLSIDELEGDLGRATGGDTVKSALSAALTSSLMFVACASTAVSEISNPKYQDAVKELGVPNALEGELDTGWEYFLTLHSACSEDLDLCTLYEFAVVDTYLSQVLAGFVGQSVDEAAPAGISSMRFREIQKILSTHHGAWMEEIRRRKGWFKLSEYGNDADSAAFLLLQHSDDIGLQKKFLPKLAALAKSGEANARNVALLSDRIAIKEGKKQLYGTQGKCEGQLAWSPFTISKPERLDERREGIGLPPMDSYRKNMAETYCK